VQSFIDFPSFTNRNFSMLYFIDFKQQTTSIKR
jgi:hypothetical protein